MRYRPRNDIGPSDPSPVRAPHKMLGRGGHRARSTTGAEVLEASDSLPKPSGGAENDEPRPIGGRNPRATFLAQVHRAPGIERVGSRNGRYFLRADQPS